MDSDWQVIYSSSQEHKLEIVKAVLEDHDISSHIINKKDSIYLFGELELYVKGDNVIRAKRIIKENGLE